MLSMKSAAFQDEGVSAQLSKEDCTKLEAEKLSGAGQEHVLEHSEDTPGHSDDVVSAGRAHASDEEGHELNSSEASSGSASSSGCREDAQNSAAEEDLDKQDAESSDMKQEAECSPSEAHLQDVNPGLILLPTQDLLEFHQTPQPEAPYCCKTHTPALTMT